MIINVFRKIWYRHLLNDGSDYHTSLLTVDKATLLDEGIYTCQVVDRGIQQCKSIQIGIRNDPNIKVEPMSITIEKGSTIKLMCTTPNMHNIGIGFGWTKNRALLKLEPGQEVWEDLYPAGSILTIIHAHKSAVYTCNVAHSSTSVRVEVVNLTLIPVCSEDSNWGLVWPNTAPGSKSLLQCPESFVGIHVSRQCTMKDAANSEWDMPDFSNCLYEPLVHPYNEFRSLTLGYESTNSSSTIQAFWDALQYRATSLYPGEGDRIIGLLQEIEHYQYNIDELEELMNSAEAMMKIIDKILSNDHSILNQQKLALLSQLILRNVGYWSKDISENNKHLSLTAVVVDILPMKVYSSSTIMYSVKIPEENQSKYPDWYNERVTIRLYHNRLKNINKFVSGVVVVYRTLAQFFPDTYITELDDGTDMEYRINSRIISVTTTYRGVERDDRFSIKLEFAGARNHSKVWNSSCGVLEPNGDWNLARCTLTENIYKDSVLQCLCSSPGTFAAFITTRAKKVILKKNNQTNFVVILGCSSCLLQCLVSILVLTTFWWKNRTWLNFLTVQCCAAIIATMSTFIYAVQTNISEDTLSMVAMCLEAFLLIGTSSPISQALIIYAELSNIYPSRQFRPTVVSVITGVPILAILTTGLTRKTVGWKHESWWFIFGTGVYNIFIICSITLLFTFLLLYISVIHKTMPLLYKLTKKSAIKLRIRMLHRSAIVIFGIVAMEISSVFYVNFSSIIYHYVFAFQSALLGFIILTMYVMNGEVLIVGPVLHKLKRQPESDDECVSEPTKKGELERKTSPSPSVSTTLPSGANEPAVIYAQARSIAVSIDARECADETAAGAYTATTRARPTPKILIHHVDDLPFDNYELSPHTRSQQLRRYDTMTTATNLGSFEAYATMEHTHSHSELVSLSSLWITPTSTTTMTTELQQCQDETDFPTKILCNAQIDTCLGSRRTSTMPDVTLAINSDTDKHRPVLSIATSIEQTFVRKQMNGKETMPVSVSSLLSPLTTRTTTAKITTTTATMPDIAKTMDRKQLDGEDILLNTSSRQREIIVNENDCILTTNGMLDRISHDLDYLLNRTKDEVKAVTGSDHRLLFPET